MLPGVFALLSDDAPVFGLVVIGGHAVVGIHPVGRRLAVGREAPEGEGRIVQLGGVGGGLCHLPDVGLRLVAEAALGQTKRPLGRDIAGADELPEFLCDLCRCRGCDEVERIVRLCRGEAEGVVAGIADTTKPAFSAEQAARGLFGQGKMVYNKYILGIKGRTIMYQKGIKRLLDVVLSACGLLVLSPLLLLLCLAIKLDSPGPVFFKQKRVGIHKSYFNILKFRTMRIDTPHDMPTHLLHDPEQYITRVGRFLRKTSLDELPQLWNILVGDMAVIGPRPALWNQYDLLAERDKYGANDVRPGRTGWAQIHGRDELEITEKAKLDGWYVEHMSFWLDIKCFFGTIKAVADHDGVVEGGTGTLHEEEKNDHK